MKRNEIIESLIKNEGKKVYAINNENLALYAVDLTHCHFNAASLNVDFDATFIELLFPISEIEIKAKPKWFIDDDEEEFFESIEELKQSEYCEQVKREFFECFTKTTL